jgi:osmoprotectant transport system permease protein
MNVVEEALLFLNDPLTWTRPGGLIDLTVQHLALTAVAVALAAVLALPLGAWLGHAGRGSGLVVWFTNASRALPTVGVIFLLATAGLFGNSSTVIAAALFAIPVLLINTFEGVRGADPAARDSARGLGMPGWRVLATVELPLATGLITAGLRTAVVQVVATVPLAALAGGGGLGRVIAFGMGTQRYGQVLAGGVLVAVLCLLLDGVLALASHALTPAPLRVAYASSRW